MNFWRIFQVVGTITAWLSQAAADGKITVGELAELLNQIAPALGLKASISLPPPEVADTTLNVTE